jgi:sRNA-binding protein
MADNTDVLDQLIVKYPRCFFRPGHLRQPLQIGIRELLIAACPEIASVRIVQALARYCGSHGYLWSCTIEGVPRLDLTGAPAGVIGGDAAAEVDETWRCDPGRSAAHLLTARLPGASSSRIEAGVW